MTLATHSYSKKYLFGNFVYIKNTNSVSKATILFSEIKSTKTVFELK